MTAPITRVNKAMISSMLFCRERFLVFFIIKFFQVQHILWLLVYILTYFRIFDTRITNNAYFCNFLHQNQQEQNRKDKENEKIEKKALNIPLDLQTSFFIIFFREAVNF